MKMALKKLEGIFNEKLNEGDIVRFITEKGNEKVGYFIGQDVNTLNFSRSYPPPEYKGNEKFTLVLELGKKNHRRINVLTPFVGEREEREVATHYEILPKSK